MAALSAPAPPEKLDVEPPVTHERLNAMMGGGLEAKSKIFMGEKGVKRSLGEADIKATDTVYFRNCSDCDFQVATYSTKILFDNCTNCTFRFSSKIITGTVDAFKCNGVQIFCDTKVGTLQLDICNKVTVDYSSAEHLAQLVWAGVEDLTVRVAKPELASAQQPLTLVTGFTQMKQQHPDLAHDTDQFIVREHDGKLLQELIVRLKNGYPTTEREAQAYDKRQELAMQQLAKEMGLRPHRAAKEGPRIKPNETCPKCSSGKKYKNCCGNPAKTGKIITGPGTEAALPPAAAAAAASSSSQSERSVQ